jgi:hypothetical protein
MDDSDKWVLCFTKMAAGPQYQENQAVLSTRSMIDLYGRVCDEMV